MSQHSKPLFDTLVRVKKVRQGESLRFRLPSGKLTKFDGRKKLVAEIWLGNKKTNRVLNPTKKGKPIPQKFDARVTKKRQMFLRNAKSGPRISAEIKEIKITLDARFTIEDNIEAKCPEMINDIVTYSRRGNGGYVTVELTLKTEFGEVFYETITAVIRGGRALIILELARMIIARFYRHEMRMSNMKISPLGNRGRYVRGAKARFTWTETKRLQDL